MGYVFGTKSSPETLHFSVVSVNPRTITRPTIHQWKSTLERHLPEVLRPRLVAARLPEESPDLTPRDGSPRAVLVRTSPTDNPVGSSIVGRGVVLRLASHQATFRNPVHHPTLPSAKFRRKSLHNHEPRLKLCRGCFEGTVTTVKVPSQYSSEVSSKDREKVHPQTSQVTRGNLLLIESWKQTTTFWHPV